MSTISFVTHAGDLTVIMSPPYNSGSRMKTPVNGIQAHENTWWILGWRKNLLVMPDDELFRKLEEQLANIVEHCDSGEKLRCSGCSGSLEVALGAVRERLSRSTEIAVESLARILEETHG